LRGPPGKLPEAFFNYRIEKLFLGTVRYFFEQANIPGTHKSKDNLIYGDFGKASTDYSS